MVFVWSSACRHGEVPGGRSTAARSAKPCAYGQLAPYDRCVPALVRHLPAGVPVLHHHAPLLDQRGLTKHLIINNDFCHRESLRSIAALHELTRGGRGAADSGSSCP
jgi:hypothetical protein